MTVLEFVIPLTKDELLVSHAGQYSVEEIVPLRAINQAIDATRSDMQSIGVDFILKHFDSFFSIIVHGTKIDLPIIISAFNRIYKAVGLLVEDLEKLFEHHKEPESEDRLRFLCISKMLAYLLSWFMCHINERIQMESDNLHTIGKKKKWVQKSDLQEDWDNSRQKALELTYRWIQLPLQKLWQPPVVEDSFITTLTHVCYKTLEQTKDAKPKHLQATIFEILGTLVKRYNHGITCVIKIIQLVKLYDTLALPLATGVMQMVNQGECNRMIKELVREISQSDLGERDARNISIFMEAVASSQPDLILPILDNITDYLANENYTMRNCVIEVIKAVVEGALTGENLTSEQREKRDECLDNLEDHILDNNAYVRSKVLQVWQHLCCEGAVPIARQGTLLGVIALRLQDKSASVRKHALQLLRALLQSNPFAAKLNQGELSRQLAEARLKLKEMQIRFISKSTRGDQERLELWNAHLPQIRLAIKQVLEKENVENPEDNDEVIDADNAFEKVRKLMLSEKVLEAVTYLQKISAKLPEAPDMGNISYGAKEECLFLFLLKIFMESEDKQTGADADKTKSKTTEEAEDGDMKKQKEEIKAQKRLVDYLEHCVKFAQELSIVIPMSENLLFSTTASDAIEACTFLGTCCQFGVAGAAASVSKALLQVFARDESVRDNVAKVYKQLYLEGNEHYQSERQKALVSVKALIKLLSELKFGQSPALAQLVIAWRANGELNPEVLQVMWEKFLMKLTDTTPDESRAALMLITMAAQAEPGIITDNLDVLIKVGFGPRAKTDLLLARDTCRALLKIKTENSDPTKTATRYANDHDMFDKIFILLTEYFTNIEEYTYISFATDAINVVYHLANQPDQFIKSLLLKVAEKGHFLINETNDELTTPAPLLARFMYLIGHIAIRQMIHLDTVVYKELKRRNALEEKKKGKKNNTSAVMSRNKTLNVTTDVPPSASSILRNKEISITEDNNGEEALDGAAADDTDAEFISTVLENDIVTGNGLLSKFVPLIMDVCQHPEKYNDENVQASGALALSKMMTVSSIFCESALQLLVTIMERSPYPGIRANVLIALTDLTVRFPNQVTPWTSHIYGRLKDPNVNVRSTCIRMLSSLIMREMVRVKGQVSELALCIIDPEPQIRQDTKQFFKDLSQKGSALYNVMPDILSRLTDSDINIKEDNLQEIFKYILELVQKEKQVDNIIEKLCTRFKLATTERQWRDLSYCLSLLQFSGKSIKRLIENLPLLKDKIHHNYVQKALRKIIEKGKKRLDAKTASAELAEKIKELLSNTENVAVNNDAQIVPVLRIRSQKKSSRKSRIQSSSEEEEDSSDSDSTVEVAKNDKGIKRKTSTFKSNSNSDSETEMETASIKAPAKRFHPSPSVKNVARQKKTDLSTFNNTPCTSKKNRPSKTPSRSSTRIAKMKS